MAIISTVFIAVHRSIAARKHSPVYAIVVVTSPSSFRPWPSPKQPVGMSEYPVMADVLSVFCVLRVSYFGRRLTYAGRCA